MALATPPRAGKMPVADPDIGLYRPGEEAAILDCVRGCFGFEPAIERWRHLYLNNPQGEPVIVVARHGPRIVSHIAGLPCRLRAFGRILTVAHTIDAMTLPDWRGQGLWRRVSLEAEKICHERNWVATFSFANELVYRGLIKHLGRAEVAMPLVMVRPLKAVRGGLLVARRLLGFRPRGGLVPEIPDTALAGPVPDHSETASTLPTLPPGWTTPTFDQRHTGLFQRAEGLGPIVRVRDSVYLRWRYTGTTSRNPYLQKDITTTGTVRSSIIVRRATLDRIPFAFVMEWLWSEGGERDGRELVKEAIHLARTLDAYGVAVLARRGTLQHRILQRYGFVSIPQLLLTKSVHFAVGCNERKEDPARWIQPANWYLTWGDGLIL